MLINIDELNRDQNTTGNTNQRISGNRVVWQGLDRTGNDNEIFYYDGRITQQITNNDIDDTFPQISGTNIVWTRSNGNNSDIYYSNNGGEERKLNADNTTGEFAQISGNNVVWIGLDGTGNDNEIFYYDGRITRQITNNDIEDAIPQISGNNIVWRGGESSTAEIYYSINGGEPRQLTTNNTFDGFPQISGNNIVWRGASGRDYEVYYENIITGRRINVSNDPAVFDGFPQISGNNIAWDKGDDNDGNVVEIYYYNGGEPRRVTNNNRNDGPPQISNNNIVWEGIGDQSREIYYSNNGGAPQQLTTNNTFDGFPQISGNNIAWRGGDSIFFGTISTQTDPPNPPPAPLRTTISLGNSIIRAEGNSGETNVTIPITLSRASNQPVTVNVRTIDGTATGDNDFTPLNRTITFAPNTTRQSITVPVRGDGRVEPDETFSVNLSNAEGATIVTGRTQVTIENDDRNRPPRENTRPEVTGEPEDINLNSGDTRTDDTLLGNLFEDAETADEDLRYRLVNNSNEDLLTAEIENNSLILQANGGDGESTLTIRATDSDGESVDTELTVSITQENTRPEVTGEPEDISLNSGDRLTYDTLLGSLFDDVETADEDLRYRLVNNSNEDLLTASIENNSLILQANDGTGESTLTISATDSDGESVDTELTINIAQENRQPEVTGEPENINLNSGDTRTDDTLLGNLFEDAETADEDLRYRLVNNSNEDILTAEIENNSLILQANGGDGESTLTIRATDSDGESIKTRLTVSITQENTRPEVTGEPENINLNSGGTRTDDTLLGNLFEDAETADEDLRYRLINNTNEDILTAEIRNNSLILEANDGTGESKLAIRATDSDGESVDTELTINIVQENTPPIVTTQEPEPIPLNAIQETENDTLLGSLFDDAETADEDLIYSIIENTEPNCLEANIEGEQLILSAAPTILAKTSELTIRAEDLSGAFVDTNLNVTVNPFTFDPPTII